MITITEVRIKLETDNTNKRLVGYASMVLDHSFVVRDLKVIKRDDGSMVVAMPSRRATDHCPRCKAKNELRARYCQNCGLHRRDCLGEEPRHYDTAHPIDAKARAVIHRVVLEAYYREMDLAKLPGYVCTFEEY